MVPITDLHEQSVNLLEIYLETAKLLCAKHNLKPNRDNLNMMLSWLVTFEQNTNIDNMINNDSDNEQGSGKITLVE